MSNVQWLSDFIETLFWYTKSFGIEVSVTECVYDSTIHAHQVHVYCNGIDYVSKWRSNFEYGALDTRNLIDFIVRDQNELEKQKRETIDDDLQIVRLKDGSTMYIIEE